MKRPARWFPLALVGIWAFGCSDDATNPAEDRIDDWAPPLGVLQDVSPPSATSTFCMEDQVEITFGTNAVPLNCTAMDVRLAATALPEGTVIECIKGEVIEEPIILRGELIAGANERWDIGVWLALDGGDALRGNADGTTALGSSCNHYYLEPPLSLDSYDGTGIGRGPAANGQYFYDGGPKDAGDTCGDLEQGVLNILEPITLTGIVCKDEDNDGFLDIGSCVAWDNNRNGTCSAANAITGTLPNTKSKCRCEPINVPIVVKEKGYLEVVKELVPSDDEGEFFLYIDAGTDDAVGVGPGGDGLTTGKVEVSAGTQTDPGEDHEVMEAAEEYTDLGFYDTSYECVDADTDEVLYSGTGLGAVGVHVMPEQ